MSFHFSKLAVGLAVIGSMASSATAQERIALESSRAFVTPTPSTLGGDVLRNYDPDAEQVVNTSSNGGFVYGTNGYGDLGKTQCFEAPATPIDIHSVTFHMVKDEAATGMAYYVVLREGAPGFDDEPGAGPGAEIYREEYDTLELTATGTPAQAVEHLFTTPQTVQSSFCIGIEWDGDAGWPAGELGVAAQNRPVSEPLSPYDWEQWDDGSWFNVNEAWTDFRNIMWIDVHYTPKTSSAEADPTGAASIRVVPNPSAGAATLSFVSTSAQHVSIEVLNTLGQRVTSLAPVAVAAGEQTLAVPMEGLSAGTYILRVTGDDFTAVRRVSVVR